MLTNVTDLVFQLHEAMAQGMSRQGIRNPACLRDQRDPTPQSAREIVLDGPDHTLVLVIRVNVGVDASLTPFEPAIYLPHNVPTISVIRDRIRLITNPHGLVSHWRINKQPQIEMGQQRPHKLPHEGDPVQGTATLRRVSELC